MARRYVALAVIFVAIVGSVAAEVPIKAPTTAPSPKSSKGTRKTLQAPAPSVSATAPVASTPKASVTSLPATTIESPPPFDLDGATPPVYGPVPGPMIDLSALAAGPHTSSGSAVEVSVVAATAAIVGFFFF